MSTMQSTVERIAAEEAAKPEPIPDWQPAGPVLTDEKMQDALAAWPNPHALGVQDTIVQPQFNLPSIGHMVVYHLRDGDSRNRRIKFPAIVMDTEPAIGLLKLWVIVDDGDTWMQDHVPAHAAPEPGWEPVSVADGPNELSLTVTRLGDRIAQLERAIAGLVTIQKTIQPIPEGVADSYTGLMENAISGVLSSEPVKRGPGRPRKV